MAPVIGAVADDFTGATDLCSVLVAEGLRTVQTVGIPDENTELPDADAVVIALKSRTAPVDEAVEVSRRALSWLRERGARQFFFKYCSTFDSTEEGNIGPVADALMDDLGATFTIVCPALPENGRTVYRGHLFVGDRLLSESSMADHPLTPMRDADLVRHLGRQTSGRVARIDYTSVREGPEAVAGAVATLQLDGFRYAVVDALDDVHLRTIGTACAELPLITGGSGAARGLPSNYRRAGLVPDDGAADEVPPVAGPAVVLAGSSSEATRLQVQRQSRHGPALMLDPMALAGDSEALDQLSARACEAVGDEPVVVAASAPPERVREVQSALGKDRAAAVIENGFARLAADLVAAGARRVIVAGGETAGAVVRALDVVALQIGPVIAPGVPWTRALRSNGGEPLGMVLKSGNFGGPDLFRDALKVWP